MTPGTLSFPGSNSQRQGWVKSLSYWTLDIAARVNSIELHLSLTGRVNRKLGGLVLPLPAADCVSIVAVF